MAGSEPRSSIGQSRAQTAPSLPPLMKGSRHSILSTSPTRGLAPSSGLGGELDGAMGGGQSEDRWRHKQQAWVEEDFPFLREEEVLPDDRFEVSAASASMVTYLCREQIRATRWYFVFDYP